MRLLPGIRSTIWSGVLSWSASLVVHGLIGVAVLIWAILAVQHLWETGVRPGQSITLVATFATPAESQLEPVEIRSQSHSSDRAEEPRPVQTKILRVTPETLAVVASQTLEVSSQTALKPATVARATAEPRLEVEPPAPHALPKATPSRLAPTELELAVASPMVSGAAVDEMPRKLSTNLPPTYPADALREGRQGRVVVRALVSAEGRVARTEIATSSGTPSLDAAALAAVENWKFSPARRRGASVEYEVLVPVRFRM